MTTGLPTCPRCARGMWRGFEMCSRCRTDVRRSEMQAQYREQFAEEIELLDGYLRRLSDDDLIKEWTWIHDPDEVAAALEKRRGSVQHRLAYMRRLCGELAS